MLCEGKNTMPRKPYPSDLSDDEWEKIKPLLPEANKLGSPRTVDLREILNAIFYRVDNGCKWRALPHDFPPHQTVYDYFRRWVRTGLWQKINQMMVRQVRVFEGRNEEPTLAIIDSHSAKGTSKGGPPMALMGIKRSKDSSGTSLLMF
jgi:putative transposase